ncbi:uncharacterized protein LOC121377409 [Gigantopelta aegis]|uniref:uncharacterized protein LOC121377409 n=1 Tax=Gigantopelta aegis TaxID=1735272 RepID=UPI001B88BBBB|nr:uncharacterized protein LOC121377409 [Gigantopelta aegis]
MISNIFTIQAVLLLIYIIHNHIVSGARCLACSRLDKKCVIEYQLPFMIGSNVCEKVRSDSTTELELCKRHPEGYHLQCELNNLSEINCKLPCTSLKQVGTGRRTGNGSESVTSFSWPTVTMLGVMIVIQLSGITCI